MNKGLFEKKSTECSIQITRTIYDEKEVYEEFKIKVFGSTDEKTLFNFQKALNLILNSSENKEEIILEND
jgi:hypothetical protein